MGPCKVCTHSFEVCSLYWRVIKEWWDERSINKFHRTGMSSNCVRPCNYSNLSPLCVLFRCGRDAVPSLGICNACVLVDRNKETVNDFVGPNELSDMLFFLHEVSQRLDKASRHRPLTSQPPVLAMIQCSSSFFSILLKTIHPPEAWSWCRSFEIAPLIVQTSFFKEVRSGCQQSVL